MTVSTDVDVAIELYPTTWAACVCCFTTLGAVMTDIRFRIIHQARVRLNVAKAANETFCSQKYLRHKSRPSERAWWDLGLDTNQL